MAKILYDNWDLIYENSDDISLHVEYFHEGRNDPSLIEDISAEDLKKKVGSGFAFHVEMDGSFDLVIHAIKNNQLYITFLMRTSEYGWKTSEQFLLTKESPERVSKLTYFDKPHGHYIIYVKEWKK